MCGIAGFIDRTLAEPAAVCRRVSDVLSHRGADDESSWTDSRLGLALVHRRLAILDLSAAGHQPMHSRTGRFVIVYNGEIYNHLAVREELRSAGREPSWTGHSDTETLLAAMEAWGVPAALRRCSGMF